jgi:protein-S-isoprenylcysteine O-methyltransferase Ste14
MSYKLIAFAVLSIFIIALSWHVIFKPKSHGFYRFFGWEGIAWLMVSNYKSWFVDPLSASQIISWILLIYASIMVIVGVVLMKTKGKADRTRVDSSLYGFERTTELIETGVYKYIRHPLYGSLIFLAWGICLKDPTAEMIVISAVSTIFLVVNSMIEEKENIKYFGEKYKEYMKRSKMFVPYLF